MSASEFATLTDDDLVTGEAVALDLPAAGLGIRCVSGLIDAVITVLLLSLVLLLMTVAASTSGQAVLWAAMILGTAAVLIGWPTTWETLTRGRTPGKFACGLRTVRDDGGPITAQHAGVRALIGVAELYVFYGVPAVISAMLSRRGKRLGDYAAGTYVVRDRVRLQLAAPVPMPPELADWARAADVATLPVGLGVAVRGFLARAESITPEARHRLGTDLAAQVLGHVAPPPPPGCPPERFLAAVAAERRARDLRRLDADQQLRQRLAAGR